MKKIFGMLLASILMFGFMVPVFAVEGEGTGTTDVEYVVEEDSFTWSIPAKLTVGTIDNMGYGTIQITNYSLNSNKKEIHIDLVGTENFNNGFNLKKANDNTLYPYLLGISSADGLKGNSIDVTVAPSVQNPVTYLIANHTHVEGEENNIAVVDGNSPAIRIDAVIYDEDKPTTAGTYTDTLTFRASIVTVQ